MKNRNELFYIEQLQKSWLKARVHLSVLIRRNNYYPIQLEPRARAMVDLMDAEWPRFRTWYKKKVKEIKERDKK